MKAALTTFGVCLSGAVGIALLPASFLYGEQVKLGALDMRLHHADATSLGLIATAIIAAVAIVLLLPVTATVLHRRGWL